jgi:hypothetical protein
MRLHNSFVRTVNGIPVISTAKLATPPCWSGQGPMNTATGNNYLPSDERLLLACFDPWCPTLKLAPGVF